MKIIKLETHNGAAYYKNLLSCCQDCGENYSKVAYALRKHGIYERFNLRISKVELKEALNAS